MKKNLLYYSLCVLSFFFGIHYMAKTLTPLSTYLILQHTIIFQTCFLSTVCVFISFFNMTTPPCTQPGPWRNGFPSLAWKNLTGLHKALTLTTSITIGINENADCVPELITQHQWWTARFRNLMGSLEPEEWRLLQQQINAHGLGRTCSTVTSCDETFFNYHVPATMLL